MWNDCDQVLKRLLSEKMGEKPNLSEDEIRDFIIGHVFSGQEDRPDTFSRKTQAVFQACSVVTGFSEIQPLVEDDDITEIMINGTRIFYEKEGKLLEWGTGLEETSQADRIIQTICDKADRTVNLSSPIADACLRNGMRASIVLSPVSVGGHSITIRKFPKTPISSGYLINEEFLTRESFEFLDRLVKARYNLFVCGGAGTGKTTLLNVLAESIPKEERIITVEDSAELKLDSLPNLVRLEARGRNLEGKGEITIRDLIRASLRMRPDRIIVGEVRGPEALDMLQAMNTGHDGSLSTGHGNSCKDMLSRLETMVLMGSQLPLPAVRRQIISAIDIFIFLSRVHRKRKITQICETDKNPETDQLFRILYAYDYGKEQLVRINEVENTGKMERYGL